MSPSFCVRADFVQSNVHKWFPKLEPHVSITLVELMDHILSTYDAKISTCTYQHTTNHTHTECIRFSCLTSRSLI